MNIAKRSNKYNYTSPRYYGHRGRGEKQMITSYPRELRGCALSRSKISVRVRRLPQHREEIWGVWEGIVDYIATSNYVLIYKPSKIFGTIKIFMSVFSIKSALVAVHLIEGNNWQGDSVSTLSRLPSFISLVTNFISSTFYVHCI